MIKDIIKNNNMKREADFYWVIYDTELTVAQWKDYSMNLDGSDYRWFMIYDDGTYEDYDFDEILEIIKK